MPTDVADWYGAVARYSESQERSVATDFADRVFATIAHGASRTTTSDQTIALRPRSVAPNRSTADSLHLRNHMHTGAECPNGLACRFVPAGYELNNSADLTDYGNFDLADRPRDGLAIRYIVIHDTETPYHATISYFQNPPPTSAPTT